MLDFIQKELKEAHSLLEQLLEDRKFQNNIKDAALLIVSAFENGKKIISCGNGGSHCDAMHFAEELTGRYRENRPPLPAIAISDPSHISCVANDYGFDQIFSRYIATLGNNGDVLLAISTSGNSKNIINAINAAKEKGMKVVSLTGKDGGKIKNITDIEIRVPHFGYADRIQEIHIKIIHILIGLIENEIEKKQNQ